MGIIFVWTTYHIIIDIDFIWDERRCAVIYFGKLSVELLSSTTASEFKFRDLDGSAEMLQRKIESISYGNLK